MPLPGSHGLQPLYNVYVKYALWETGWRTNSMRRLAHGTTLFQMTEMFKHMRVGTLYMHRMYVLLNSCLPPSSQQCKAHVKLCSAPIACV